MEFTFSNQFEGCEGLNEAIACNDTLIRRANNPETNRLIQPLVRLQDLWDHLFETWIEFTYSEVGFHRSTFPKISALRIGKRIFRMWTKPQSFEPGSFTCEKDRRKPYLQVDISSDTLWIIRAIYNSLVGTQIDVACWRRKNCSTTPFRKTGGNRGKYRG